MTSSNGSIISTISMAVSPFVCQRCITESQGGGDQIFDFNKSSQHVNVELSATALDCFCVAFSLSSMEEFNCCLDIL